jgi:hypothetical protein
MAASECCSVLLLISIVCFNLNFQASVQSNLRTRAQTRNTVNSLSDSGLVIFVGVRIRGSCHTRTNKAQSKLSWNRVSIHDSSQTPARHQPQLSQMNGLRTEFLPFFLVLRCDVTARSPVDARWAIGLFYVEHVDSQAGKIASNTHKLLAVYTSICP